MNETNQPTNYKDIDEEVSKKQKIELFTETQKGIFELLIDGRSASRRKATEKAVEWIKKYFTIKTTRSDEQREIWVFKEGIYIPEGDTIIEEECRALLTNNYTTTFKNEVSAKIQADTFIDPFIFFNKQNECPHLIPINNGVLNLDTKELVLFSSEYYFFTKVNAFLDPDAQCPLFYQFLTEIMKNEEDINTIQELIGFCLYRAYKFEKAFMFTGEGRNGKSKLLEVMKTFLTTENCANLNLQTLEKDHFSLSELHNKLVNISGEVSSEALNNTGNFKALTGRDQIYAARKFKTYMKFTNYAKLIFAANEIPRTTDMSLAFFQRWVILEFPYTFLPKEEYELKKENKLVCLQKPDVIQEIINDEKELSGILNWALEGLDRLQNNKEFSSTQYTEQVRDFWIMKSDSVVSFLQEMIVEDVENFIPFSTLKMDYHNYCRQNNLKSVPDKRFSMVIRDSTNATSESLHYPSGNINKIRGFSGLRYRNKNEERQIKF